MLCSLACCQACDRRSVSQTAGSQENDPASTLTLYRTALALRRDLGALGDGPLRWLPSPSADVLIFEQFPFACLCTLEDGGAGHDIQRFAVEREEQRILEAVPELIAGAHRVSEGVQREHVETAWLVPSMCEAILSSADRHRYDIGSLAVVTVSGAAVSSSLIERFSNEFKNYLDVFVAVALV